MMNDTSVTFAQLVAYMRHHEPGRSGQYYESRFTPSLLLLHAGFRPTDVYFLAYMCDPPTGLVDSLFPPAARAFVAVKGNTPAAKSARMLARRLVDGRQVFLCGSVLVRRELPDLKLWDIHPFNTVEYRTWCDEALAHIDAAADMLSKQPNFTQAFGEQLLRELHETKEHARKLVQQYEQRQQQYELHIKTLASENDRLRSVIDTMRQTGKLPLARYTPYLAKPVPSPLKDCTNTTAAAKGMHARTSIDTHGARTMHTR